MAFGTDVRLAGAASRGPRDRCEDGPMTDRFTIDTMLRLPRLSSLKLSPDGRRLVAAVGGVSPDGKSMANALWQLDPHDAAPARRLTRSVQGEGAGIAFLPDGALLFESKRPDPDAKPDLEKKVNALWALPAEGGEARLLVAPEGGVCGIAVARDAHALVFGANVQRGSRDFGGDTERTTARKDAGVEALLFDDYPIRHWDHYLGPRVRRLYAATVPEGEQRIDEPRDLDEAVAGFTFDESDADISPEGSFVVAVRRVFNGFPETLDDLVRYDSTTGEARQLTLVLIDADSGEQRQLAADVDRRPESIVWGPDASVLYFTADDEGHHAAYRVDLPDGRTTRLTGEGAVTDLCPTPDGS